MISRQTISGSASAASPFALTRLSQVKREVTGKLLMSKGNSRQPDPVTQIKSYGLNIKRRTTLNRGDNVIHTEWVGDRDYAVLIDAKRGRLLGWCRHDGYGKWDLQVYVSPWQARKIIRRGFAGVASWSAFPRMAVWIFRFKTFEAAYMTVQSCFGDVDWDEAVSREP